MITFASNSHEKSTTILEPKIKKAKDLRKTANRALANQP